MFDPNLDGRTLLIYLAVICQGDFQKMITMMRMKDYDVSPEKA